MLTPVLIKMATEIRNTADTPMTVDISTDSRLLMSYSSRDSRSQPRMRAAIAATGYELKGVHTAPYEKKGLFSFRK